MNNIVTLFTTDTGIFSRFLQFETIVLIAFLMFIFTYYFKDNYGFIIILLIFVLYITNIYIGYRKSKITDFNRETEIYLQEIQRVINKIIEEKLIFYNNSNGIKLPQKDIDRIYENNNLEYLHIDANMIRFIHSFLELHSYTDRGFYVFIKGVNNILKIRYEIEEFYEKEGKYPENITEMFEIAIGLKRNTVNNLHKFIYSVPKDVKMYKYINDIVSRYDVLISRNLDIIHKYYLDNIKMTGFNTRTKIISYNTTKPYDKIENHSVIPHKNSDKSNNPHGIDNSHVINFYY